MEYSYKAMLAPQPPPTTFGKARKTSNNGSSTKHSKQTGEEFNTKKKRQAPEPPKDCAKTEINDANETGKVHFQKHKSVTSLIDYIQKEETTEKSNNNHKKGTTNLQKHKSIPSLNTYNSNDKSSVPYKGEKYINHPFSFYLYMFSLIIQL